MAAPVRRNDRGRVAVKDIAALARGVILTGLTDFDDAARAAGFSGYALFSRNGTSAAELRAFTDALRAHRTQAPILAIDQEGGRVARLQEGVEIVPSMMALGAANDLDLARRAGEQIAFDLRRAGCTLDFAPVLDLALDPRNTVIGTRSFGADPQRVAALGKAVASGLIRGGITPCFKHFPGHGSTAVDSHETLPVIETEAETLFERDVVPFAAVARAAPAMMTAHVLVRSLDADSPATCSRAIATGLLRERLGFTGVLVTDCLEMGAVSQRENVAVAALVAGADLLTFSHRVDLALEAASAIVAAVESGRLSLERLQEAYGRVEGLRLAAQSPISLDESPPHPGIGREIGRRAVTLIRGVPEVDPLAAFAISFGGDVAMLRREAPALETVDAALDPSAESVAAILASLERSERRPLVLARRAHLYRAQASAIAQIVERYYDAVVVSTLEPFDLPLFGSARHLLATYGDDQSSIGGLADVLFGSTMPTGELPVQLPVSW